MSELPLWLEFLFETQGDKISSKARKVVLNYVTRIESATSGDGLNPDTFNELASLDPTSSFSKKNKPYQFIDWIIREYTREDTESRSFDDKTMQDVARALDIFYHIKNSLSVKQREISRYTLDTFLEFINDIENKIYKETGFYFHGPEGLIVRPKTEIASRYWGAGASWCTARPGDDLGDWFQTHTDGPLVIYIPFYNENDLISSPNKYQGHYRSTLRNKNNAAFKDMPPVLGDLIAAALIKKPSLVGTLVKDGSLNEHPNQDLSMLPDEISKNDRFWTNAVKNKKFWRAIHYKCMRKQQNNIAERHALQLCMSQKYKDLSAIPPNYWNQRPFCLAALTRLRAPLEVIVGKIPNSFKRDAEFIRAAIRENEDYYDFVPIGFKASPVRLFHGLKP